MTNNWTDIGNATMVLVMGANPSENHPACMAHINNARKGPHTWYDGAGVAHVSAKPKAKLVVVDPRKTRTALQADMYVRIRPGTDIAFINAMCRYVIATMEALDPTDNVREAFELYHTTTKSANFMNDASALTGMTVPKYSDATFQVSTSGPTDGTDYVRATTSGISNFPQKVALTAADSVYTKFKSHVDHYTLDVAAAICGCTAAQIQAVADLMIANSRCSSINGAGAWTNDPASADYRSTTMLYAMGLTQHTYASQNVKSFATIQTLLGNMGRAGGGVNALRGIHNVQGSTDMGLLYHLIPGYSGNPTQTRTTNPEAFGDYIDKLWGSRIRGNGYANAYKQGAGHGANLPGLQQAGFFNMTRMWFADATAAPWEASGATSKGANSIRIDHLYDLWPKTNGDNHIQMFRKMAAGTITAAMVWGQNPAITEPNQGSVRAGLKNLDMLVCVDMFENETASCDRKTGGITYLIPACSHVEEAGSATNSGRVLQWRYEARKPAGDSKADLELLLRFAYALDGADAFSHIKTVWARPEVGIADATVYPRLYGDQYGWTPPVDGSYPAFDSELVASKMYQQMTNGSYAGGTLWIYTGGGDGVSLNKAKLRSGADNGNRLFSTWGYSWLINRRVLYNQGDVPGDVADDFQTPDKVARLFVPINSTLIDYGHANYRFVHGLADKPDVAIGSTTSVHKFPGRFPCHTEPYETAYDGTNAGKPDFVATYGRNTSSNMVGDVPGGTAKNLIYTTTKVAGLGRAGDPPSSQFPLTLTTIRCVEHFQGGPITRNNWHNVEAEPEPWIELSSYDARLYGIRDGDMVKVVTARTEDYAGDTIEASFPRALYGSGFRARVGVGLADNQRVGQGVVAIPWHWGERGLSTGSRANDLCLDAMDANTTIPEYKACLCRIEKI